jgi:hypothetical protein
MTDIGSSAPGGGTHSNLGDDFNVRNDLSTNVTNATPLTLRVQSTVEHGNLSGTSGTNPLYPPPPGSNFSIYTINVSAAGAGSTLYQYITSGANVWGIILGCPPNEDNYFQYVYYGWPKAMSDTYNAAKDSQKYHGGHIFTAGTGSTAQGTQVFVGLTNNSPAAGDVQFTASP